MAGRAGADLARLRLLRADGAGINATAGLDAFTAHDSEHFLRIACDWNTRREALAELRAGLRAQLAASPLFEGALFTPAFEAALRAAATA